MLYVFRVSLFYLRAFEVPLFQVFFTELNYFCGQYTIFFDFVFVLLGRDAALLCKTLKTFWNRVSIPSSGVMNWDWCINQTTTQLKKWLKTETCAKLMPMLPSLGSRQVPSRTELGTIPSVGLDAVFRAPSAGVVTWVTLSLSSCQRSVRWSI
jgi:hypothetical protein